MITFHQAGIGRPPARGPAGRRWPRLAGLDDAAVAFDWAAGPPYSAYAHPVSWTCASCASRVADYGPYSGEREEGHAAGCARVDRERAARAVGWAEEDKVTAAERRADDRGPGRVSLARLPYREPAPELAAAVDRFLAVRDLPTSRRSYRQVLTAVTAEAGRPRPVGDLNAPDLAAALTASYGAAAAATALLAAKARHRSWRTTQRHLRITEDDDAKLTADHDPNRRRQ